MKYLLIILLAADALCQMELTKYHVKGHASVLRNGGGSMTLDDYDGFQYYGIFTLGTPAQQTTIITDTGSDQLWIPTNNATCYRASASSTANITTTKGGIQYGQGSVSGYMGTEVLGAPSLSLTNLKMATLFVDVEQQMSGQQACGLMGLSNNPSWKNFLEVAVTSQQLSDAQFAFQLKGPSSKTLFYAGSTNFPSTYILTWFTVVRQNYWAISVTNTMIDSQTYVQPTGLTEGVLDTGTSLVLMGQNAYDGLIANAAISANCQQQQGYVICPCGGSGFPNVYFTCSGKKLKITPTNYLDELSGYYCMLGFEAIDPSQIPFVLLGDVFLRDYFYALDKSNNKLGLYGPGIQSEEKGFLQ